MGIKPKNMIRVGAICNLGGMLFGYDSAHSSLKTALANARKIESSSIALTFRDLEKTDYPFLFGVSECINANSDIKWMVTFHDHPDGVLDILSGLSPSLKRLSQDDSPYVFREF